MSKKDVKDDIKERSHFQKTGIAYECWQSKTFYSKVICRRKVKKEEEHMQYYNKKAVGARIRQMRLENRITQSKLAEYLDYTTERQLQRIESGETGCAIDKLVEIAQILNTSTDYLLFGIKEDSVGGILGKLFHGKTQNQKIFMMRVMKVIADNIDLVDSNSTARN